MGKEKIFYENFHYGYNYNTPLFISRTANMSSAQKSEEIEEDYDPVSKNSKIFQVENLVDFFYRTP